MKIWFGWNRKQRLWAIFALAMVLRLAFIIPRGNNIAVPYRDQNTYYMLGRALAEDGFLGPPTNREAGPYYEYRQNHPPPMGVIPEIRVKMMERWDAEKRYYGVMKWGAPSSFFEPLYPFFSAFVYKVFGDRFLYHRILLAVMSAFTCIIIFAIGRRLFSEGTGYIAALISAFYPYFIFYTVFLMSEIFIIFFLALSVYYFVRLKDEPGWKNGLLFGIALGLAFLTRSIVLGLIPFFILLLIVYNPKKLLLPSALAVLFFALTISPWVIRNYALHGEFVLLSTRGGYNIWMRNNPFYYQDELALLGYEVPAHLLKDIKYGEYLDFPQFSADQDEIERNRILTQEGIKFIRQNPSLFAHLCWIRFQTLIGLQGTLSQGLIYKLVGLFSFGILFPLGLISLAVHYKGWRETLPLALIFAYFVGVHTLTHDGIRYRLPADPYLIILASVLIERMLNFIAMKMKGEAAPGSSSS